MDGTAVLLKSFSGTRSGPRKYGFGVKTGVLDHTATAFLSSFDGSVEVWLESVLLGLKLLFGSTQRAHFSSNPTAKKLLKPHVVGWYENAVNTVQNTGAAKKVLTFLKLVCNIL